ncbi:type II secretion system major pseudopilin GspG [Desulfobacterales bacterium HSG2]|nr:type II secretion system major pseudopilin GspG [Desulfobacterales bacterium HSG2]
MNIFRSRDTVRRKSNSSLFPEILQSCLFVLTLVVCFPMQASANMASFPIIPGLFYFGTPAIFSSFALTVIIEFLIIAALLKAGSKIQLLWGVFFIHMISYPLTLIFGSFFSVFAEIIPISSVFAEIIPISLEPRYYNHLFERFRKKGLSETVPSSGNIFAVAFLANMVTFLLGMATMVLHEPPHINMAKAEKTKIDVASIDTALKMYRIHNGTYPTTEQGLRALVERPEGARKWREGGYIKKGRVPKDSWGNDFVYVCPGIHGDFDLTSYGSDGVPGGKGGKGDINNWDL